MQANTVHEEVNAQMMTNEEFWKYQHSIYQNLPYERSIRYESWQPGRWAANRSAILELLPRLGELRDICEVGAGSAAFGLELGRQTSCRINAVDLCPAAADYAAEIAHDMGIELNYTVGDLFSYEKKSDLVLSLGVMEHFSPEMQEKFVCHCRDISKQYVLVAIPNQDSVIFRNYVAWSNRESRSYEEEHQPLTTDSLMKLIRQAGMKIVHADGFQVFLSERVFWNETPISRIPLYQELQCQFAKGPDRWADFPCMDFAYEDIPRMVALERALKPEDRLRYGFMSYVLAEV